VPASRYLGRVFMDRKTFFDPVFDPIDDLIYRLTGRKLVSM